MPPNNEQALADMRKIQNAQRLRVFIKDKFYPALVAASTSIDDAKFLLGSFSAMMMEQFLAKMKETNFASMNLSAKLDPTSPKYGEFVKMIHLFDKENVYDARELVEGMKNEIEMMINDELKERKLETLKTNFLE